MSQAVAGNSGGFGDVDALQNNTTGRKVQPLRGGMSGTEAQGAWQVDFQILQMLQGFFSVLCAV